jgi:hypothetical protein
MQIHLQALQSLLRIDGSQHARSVEISMETARATLLSTKLQLVVVKLLVESAGAKLVEQFHGEVVWEYPEMGGQLSFSVLAFEESGQFVPCSLGVMLHCRADPPLACKGEPMHHNCLIMTIKINGNRYRTFLKESQLIIHKRSRIRTFIFFITPRVDT